MPLTVTFWYHRKIDILKHERMLSVMARVAYFVSRRWNLNCLFGADDRGASRIYRAIALMRGGFNLFELQDAQRIISLRTQTFEQSQQEASCADRYLASTLGSP